MGGGETKTVENSSTTPWVGQQPYLSNAFSEAKNIYDANKSNINPGYQGDYVAGADPSAVTAFQNALGYGNGIGGAANNAGTAISAGQAATGAAASNAATGGLFNYANSDVTGNNIANAGRYVNNDILNGQIDAALRDPTRQLTEQTLPQIDRNAAAGGNLNSSRTGVAAGIAQRGYQDTASDIAAQLRGAAYQNGITQAAADANSQNAALTSAGQLGQGALSSGLSGIAAGADNAQKMNDTALTAGAGLTSANQATIDNDLAKYNAMLSQPYANLQQYWNVVGDKSWGSQTQGTSTQSQQMGLGGMLGSGLGILGALFRSDKRVKTDIERIGNYANGLPKYRYEYKDEPGVKYVGPMAQDVAKVDPDNVVNIGGVLHVHTNALL